MATEHDVVFYPKPESRRFHDITGMSFGKLTVIGLAAPQVSRAGNKTFLWWCRCECGGLSTASSGNLKSGLSKSCGCSKRDGHCHWVHGKSHTPEHNIWCALRQRCSNHLNTSFQYYGGRGIAVCDRWDNSFENFLDDMGPRPSPKHSIDRIDVNGNYEPGNCRWATSGEQGRNKRDNRLIEYKGRSQCLSAWAEELGMPMKTLFTRINQLKWTPEKAMTTPVRPNSRHAIHP